MNYETIPDHEHYSLNTRHFDRHMILLHFPSLSGKRVLEIGCGYGHFSNYIFQAMKPSLYHAYDKDRNAIAYAKEHYENLTFFDGDVSDSTIRREEYGNQDCVFSMYVIEAITTREILIAFFQKSYAALHEGGIFWSLTNNPCIFGSSRSKYFSHNVPHDIADGDMFTTDLYFTEKDSVIVNDTYRSSEYIVSLMKDVGFVDISFKQPLVKQGSYPDVMDEAQKSPVRIITARKE